MAVSKNKKAAMTGWFDPGPILRTGVRVAASTYFGRLVDRRHLMAALDPFDVDDFSHTHVHLGADQFWFDYVADMGDGWHPTFAVARLLAAPSLEVARAEGDALQLNRGSLLVMGGDQVYPWPTIADYKQKLEAPFKEANELYAGADYDRKTEKFKCPHWLYAIPGNHDWYDGLTAFTYRFCARRPNRAGRTLPNEGHAIGGRSTLQTRSYFACKLPGKWWLCGVDVQIEGWIDDEQNAYFHYISQRMMEHGSNVIICAPNPEWAYLNGDRNEKYFDSISYISAIISGDVADRDQADQASFRFQDQEKNDRRRHYIRVMLAGDAHHYARYVEGAESAGNTSCTQYITCGMGGAFMHGTHWLPEAPNISRPYPPPNPVPADRSGKLWKNWLRVFERKHVYPPAETTSAMTWGNLFFGFLNPKFSAGTAALSFLIAWQLVASATAAQYDIFRRFDASLGLVDFVTHVLMVTPAPMLASIAIVSALYYLCDYTDKRKRFAGGFLHATLHILGFLIAFGLGARLIAHWHIEFLEALLGANVARQAALTLFMAAYGFLVPPFIFGLYLITMLQIFGVHWNEAFSALRMEAHKGFLRMRIGADNRLTVFPIVIDRCRDAGHPLEPKLIEAPIVFDQIDAPPPRPA